MISEHVVRAAQRGDTVAMNDVLDALAPYVGKICGPIALTDGPDAAQEALIAIFRGLRSLQQPEALFGWARAIAVREAVRVARRGQRQQPTGSGTCSPISTRSPPSRQT
jgi:RNA polymerase sigma-70 factor (ECF subfamily)